jgi:hypothetical protein
MFKKLHAAKEAKAGHGDAHHDAEALHKAMRGIGTDEKVLVEIFSTRSRKHIQEVKKKFHELYSKSLEDWIKGDCSGTFEKLLIDLCDQRTELKCKYIRKATAGLGTDEGVIVQILCPCSDEELKKINECYKRLYGSDLSSLLDSELSGDFKELMREILKCHRPSDEEHVDEGKAKEDAEKLWSEGEGKLGTNEKVFIEILTHRSRAHIQRVFKHYEQKTGHTFERGLKSETSGDFRRAVMAIVTPQPEYHSHLFNEAMKGAGTKDDQLIRLMSTLTKSQLKHANEVYTKKHNITLREAIKRETSGSYQDLMCGLVPPVA